MYPTIIRTYETEVASVQPAVRPTMTLPVHADQPIPIHVPTPRRRGANPANRTAYPPLVADEPCGRCHASPLMRREYYYRGITIRMCMNCGWDGYRRAGEGMPDHCGKADTLFAKPCDELRPCAKHR